MYELLLKKSQIQSNLYAGIKYQVYIKTKFYWTLPKLGEQMYTEKN